MTPNDVWVVLGRLAETPPTDLPRLSDALGVTLDIATETPTHMRYVAASAGPFRDVVVLEPKPGATAVASVSLGVADGVCATWDEANAKLGVLNKRPGHPDRPTPLLEYWSSERGWGVVILGFDRDDKCLATASVQTR